MKKIIALILSLILIISSFSFCITAFALKTTNVPKTRIGMSETYYEFDAQTKTLTLSGSGAIPNMLNDDTSQPWNSWRSDGSIEKVIVEEGITGIGNYVLYYVSAKEVQLPSTLKKIGNFALAYNTAVESISIPFGVTSIGASAFENCISMTEIDIPDTVTLISKDAFEQCYKLESVVIPHSVTSIGNYAFHRCLVLSSVKFESLSTLEKIGNYAFQNCPMLSELAVPAYATVGKLFYGVNDSGTKYENASMKLFSGSDAIVYAKTKSIPYTQLDVIPIELGAINKNEFFEETVSNAEEYSFTPETNGVYNIYSTGEVDLSAVLSDDSGELLRSDDISKDNLNFCLTYEMQAGKEYIITVSSVRSVGEYAVIAYPDEIESFEVKGSLAFNADDGKVEGDKRIFEITDDMLTDFILDISFGGGFKDKIYYSPQYFNNRFIAISDKQKEEPFTCGNNTENIAIGEVESGFSVFIEHSYEEEIIPYTVDDDGYSIFTCILCSDTYKGNFVPTPAVTVSGKAYLMETPDGGHSHSVAYPWATFFANDRTYYIDEEGNWSVNTFDDLDLVFENENGKDVSVHIDVEDEDVEYGAVVFEGYDFNEDGYVNAKDFAFFIREKEKKLGDDYWKYAPNFFLKNTQS